MKIFIEVEVGPDEITLATELFRTLRSLTDHVKTRDIKTLFHTLISRLQDPSQLDMVAPQILTLLHEDSSHTVFDDFLSAFMDAVFNPVLVEQQQSVMPFMLLLNRLPEAAKLRMHDGLVPKVLRHLTIKRPIDADRRNFLAHAEAFSALVNMEFVPVTGAVSTIVALLRKSENRNVAVTVLKKTVELCLKQLNNKCDPAILAELRACLLQISDKSLQYDINYIEEIMGWKYQPGAGQLEIQLVPNMLSQGHSLKWPLEPSSTGHGLYAAKSYTGHQNTIFAMAYDENRSQLVSSDMDGSLITWRLDGQIVDTMNMPQHYACSMDAHSSLQNLLVCGVAKEDANSQVGNRRLSPPCILCYDAADRGWEKKGILLKESSKLVLCIKALEGAQSIFITGESVVSSSSPGTIPRTDELVCCYDLQAASTFSSLQPIKKYGGHEDLITCISTFPPNSNIFLSGSRDTTIRMWDLRKDRQTGMFGTIGKAGVPQAHESMITCINALDANLILSASTDTKINCWDFRLLGGHGGNSLISSLSLDESGILKFAVGGAACTAAVSTLFGLYMVDFSNPQPVACLSKPFQDGRKVGRYHDLKWDNKSSTLYAAGDDKRIDVYLFG